MTLNLYDILKEVLNEDVTPYDVTSAINNKQKVIITYDDRKYHRVGSRIVEPYVYGVNTHGNDCVRVFLSSGDSYRGHISQKKMPRWETIKLANITSWQPTNDYFNRPPNERGWNVEPYNNDGDGSFTTIYTQAKFTDDELNTDMSKYSRIKRENDIDKEHPNREFITMDKLNISGKDKDYGPVQQPNKTSDSATTTNNPTNNIVRGPLETPAIDNQSKGDDYWAMFDKARAEANYQDDKRKFTKSGNLRQDKRELERQRRRDNFDVADERSLARKGALNYVDNKNNVNDLKKK